MGGGVPHPCLEDMNVFVLSCVVNTMAADDLATPGTRESAAMVST